ncbi:MAG: hypothetical protein AAGL17_13675 [Cyanobacteria bacterium J06576_12]
MTSDEERSALSEAIAHMHGCSAVFVQDHEVTERHNGSVVWKGVVTEFSVDSGATTRCYAWASSVEGFNSKKFYAVLQTPPIHSPLDAVRASIVADLKNSD